MAAKHAAQTGCGEWPQVGKPRLTVPGLQAGSPHPTLLTCGGAIANGSRGTCPVPETTSAHIMPGLRRIQSAGALRQVMKDALERVGAMLANAAD
jgi:hypothetical protein